MTVYVDTSAFFAVLDRDDLNHDNARERWIDFIQNDVKMVCSNYVLVESFALIQRRLGLKALRVFQEDMLPMVYIEWVNGQEHHAGVASLFLAFKKSLSLVDSVSFVVMRSAGIDKVFTYDKHFKREGFDCLGI